MNNPLGLPDLLAEYDALSAKLRELPDPYADLDEPTWKRMREIMRIAILEFGVENFGVELAGHRGSRQGLEGWRATYAMPSPQRDADQADRVIARIDYLLSHLETVNV